MWFTKLRHFLNENGELADSYGPAKKLAEFLCSIVKAVTSYILEISVATGVRCRRRPKRKPCKGEVYAFLDDEQGIIEWHCFICGDRGHITDWENTQWDMRFSDIIIVRLNLEERDLIQNETLASPDLTGRLESADEVLNSITAYYTPEELEALLGYIAAEANHASDKDLEDALDVLYESLEDLLDSTKLKTSH